MSHAALDRLSPEEKRALLARLKQKQQATRLVPLSVNQERIWFFHQLDPSHVFNTMAPVLDLEGRLDVALLEQCYRRLIARHGSLRTRIKVIDGVPHAEEMPTAQLKLSTVDLGELSATEARTQIDGYYARERARSFDLAKAPLLRVTLFRLTDRRHVLLSMMHHIISDGGSQAIMVRELSELYAAAQWQMALKLPPLPMSYADFAEWQRRYVESARMRDEIHYWRANLADVPQTLELPAPGQRESVATGLIAREIPEELSAALNAYCRRHKTTPFTVLLAAFKILLYRYTGQQDQVVGTVVAGRQRPELEGLIGLFINTLVLRTRLEPTVGLSEALGKLQATIMEAFSHQNVPYSRLVEALCPNRGSDRNPLFATTFSLQADITRAGNSFPGLSWAYYYPPMELQLTEALDLEITPKNGVLHARLLYQTERVDRALAEQIMRGYTLMLQYLLAEPQTPLARIPLLERPPEATTPHRPAYRSVIERFEDHAAQHPQRPAVYDPEHERWLTYGELESGANRIAHRLRNLGVIACDVVGLHVSRNGRGITALLGLLKAGAAYLPLDPSLPEERLTYMLTQASVRVLISEGGRHFPHVVLPLDPASYADSPDTRLEIEVAPEWPAYLIFTSGSTGRPKGVCISQDNWQSYVEARPPGYREGWRHLQMAGLSFDVFACDFARALCLGGSLVLVPRHLMLEPERLYTLIEHTQPDFAEFVPAVLRLLAEVLIPRGLRLPLKLVSVGSDAWTVKDYQTFRHLIAPDARLINTYGITETSCENLVYDGPPRGSEGRTMPVGQPLDHTAVWLLDRNLEPLPAGPAGELYLGGPCVGCGYLNDPSRTARSFVPDPYTTIPGARLYRSGDRMRMDEQGQLVFLGRVDHQVKVRGFRIETGEVEAALTALEGIESAAVRVFQVDGEAMLCGFIVGEALLRSGPVKRALAEHLPEYMVPSRLKIMERFPLNANGKIDRGALLLPEPDASDSHETVAPRNETERILAEIWAEELGIERVGVNDNFFVLGGDSIRSTRVVARARERGLALSLQQVFAHPTITEQAELCGATQEEHSELGPFSLVDEPLAGFEAAWPLSPNQAYLVLEQLREPGTGIGRDASSLHLRIRFDAASLAKAWGGTVAAHEVLRSTVVIDDKQLLQRVHGQVPDQVVFEDLRHMDDDAQERYIYDQVSSLVREPIDWEKAPLVQCHVHRRAEDRIQLTFILPAALLDGWSQAAMRTDLLTRYRALLDGEHIGERPQTVPYRAYVARVLVAEKDPKHQQFWDERLAGAVPRRLPTSWLATTANHDGDREQRYFLPLELSERLHEQARTQARPLKTLLLAAHFRAVSQLCGTADVVTGLVSAGRGEGEDRTLGLYVNTVPLRLQLETESWRQLIERVYQLEADHLPYLDPAGAHLHLPEQLYQVGFSFTHFHIYQQADLASLDLLSRRTVQLTRLPLMVGFNEEIHDGRLRLDLAYGPHIEEAAMIEVRNLYLELLHQLCAGPDDVTTSSETFEPPIEIPPTAPRATLQMPQNEAEWGITEQWANLLERRPIGMNTRLAELATTPEQALRLWHLLGRRNTLEQLLREGTPQMNRGNLLTQERRMGPLSASQRRMWFLYQLEGANSAYNVVFGQVMEGVIDLQALDHAYQQVARRHEVLRVNLTEREGVPVQQVNRTCLPPLLVIQLDAEDERQARRIIERELAHRFSLETEPLARLIFVRLGRKRGFLLANLHHVVADGWSMELFTKELATLYKALVENVSVPMTPPKQFIEVAREEAEARDEAAMEPALAWWLKALEGAPTVLELPYDRPRPVHASGQGDTHVFRLEASLVARLERLAVDAGTTLFVVLLAAWKVLLARHTNVTDLLSGTPVAHRHLPEHQDMIGFFANTLVMRARLAENPTVGLLLEQMRTFLTHALAHDRLPFEVLAEHLSPERGLAYNPVFQVMFALQNAGGTRTVPFRGLKTYTVDEMERFDAAFDLSLSLMPIDTGLLGVAEYATDLFDGATVARMMTHYENLLRAMCTSPDQQVQKMPMLTRHEKRQLFNELSGEPCDYPDDETFPELFAASVVRNGSREALVYDDGNRIQTYSYRELDALSNGLAHYLNQRGIGAEDVVGLYLDRKPAAIVAMLAVSKAGAAWLSLDPNIPEERLAFIIEDAAPSLVLRQAGKPIPADCETVALDERGLPEGVQPEAQAPAIEIQPDRLAYVIYTSGSTGRPKGVLLHHRGMCLFLHAEGNAIGIGPEDRMLQFASHGFDASIGEIGEALVRGACLVLAPRELLMAGPGMVALMQRQRVSAVILPPTVLAYLETSQLPDLRVLASAGEALSAELVARHVRPGMSLVNLYGPTETTVGVTCSKALDGQRRPDIGKPIGRAQLYILDRLMQPLPQGCTGKLYIGGPVLARGYGKRPGLTASRFLPDPFSTTPGARLYDSGDLLRFLPDGRLDHVGRADSQVKLRGFRIELGEIENALLRLEGIETAAVWVRDRNLVAAITGTNSEESSLRRQLALGLPDYMVPAEIHHCDALPLNPSGKVDRARLSRELTGAQRTLQTARTALEEKLVTLWQELLGLEQVGIDEHFFALGGHSLLAVRLLHRIETICGVKLSLAALFRAGTIAGLASEIAESRGEEAHSWVCLRAEGSGDPLYLVHPIGGDVFAYSSLATYLDRPVYAARARGLEQGQPQDSVTAMARCYLDGLPERGAVHLAGWSFGGTVAFEMARQLEQQGRGVSLTLIDSHEPGALDTWDETTLALGFAGDLLRMLGVDLADQMLPKIESRGDAGQVIIEQLLHSRHLPEELTIDRLTRAYAVFRAAIRADEAYLGGDYGGTIHLIRAQKSPDHAGWKHHAKVVETTIPGDHYTIMAEPGVKMLAEAMH